MGIKFYCPNGHKLNVKSFLSGKKAICPKCGAKVLVPPESQPPPPNAEADDQSTPGNGTVGAPIADQPVRAASAARSGLPSAGVAGGGSNQPARIAGPGNLGAGNLGAGNLGAGMAANPAAFAQPAMPSGPLPAGWGTASAAAGAGFGVREPVAAPTIAAAPAGPFAGAGFGPAGVRDAIDEAPTAVWYVRPASGGQFGPAPGETMRAWIDEGRVAATALVWRAGWPEWRSAAAIFPKLAATVAAPWSPTQNLAAPVAPVATNPWGTAAGASAAPLGIAPVAPVGMAIAPVQSVAVATPAGLPIGQVIGDGAVPVESYLSTESDEYPIRSRRRRQRGNDVTMIVSIILVVLTIVLVVVLAIVLSRQNEPAAAPPQMYHGPKAPEAAKEKPETKSAAKAPAKKKEQAKKAPPAKAKPADAMDDDSDDE